MNFELPDFGKKNIKCIDFNSDNHNIIVYRYGMKKGEEIIQKIPKKRNNEQDLINSFYKEMKDYLDTNVAKYESYNYTKLKKKLNKNLIKSLIFASIVMMGSSIPLLSTYGSLGFLGITLDVIALPTFIAGINLSTKQKNDDRKEKFIKEYEEIYNRYRVCANNDIKTIKPTEYRGISNDNANDKIYNINKKRELKKPNNNLKNAV